MHWQLMEIFRVRDEGWTVVVLWRKEHQLLAKEQENQKAELTVPTTPQKNETEAQGEQALLRA